MDMRRFLKKSVINPNGKTAFAEPRSSRGQNQPKTPGSVSPAQPSRHVPAMFTLARSCPTQKRPAEPAAHAHPNTSNPKQPRRQNCTSPPDQTSQPNVSRSLFQSPSPALSEPGSDSQSQHVARDVPSPTPGESAALEPDPADSVIRQLLAGYSEPNQPDVSTIPAQKVSRGAGKGDKNLRFNSRWFRDFPWLHFHPGCAGVVCFDCANAHSNGGLSLENRKDQSFISTGFSNWKKGDKSFPAHESSTCHKAAKEFAVAKRRPAISAQILSAKAKDQACARDGLLNLIKAVRYILRQGIASRGHLESEGNLNQLLSLLSELSPSMLHYLNRDIKFTSHECITEISRQFSHGILRKLVKLINDSGQFSIMCDGTLDICQKEQLSICVRYVDESLTVHEVFLGLYEINSTTGLIIATSIMRGLQSLGLNLDFLRGQTYDGAANMTGEQNGCQAHVAADYPLALHFKCSAHSTNLVVQSVCESSTLLSDSLDCVHELGKLFKNSGKFARICESITANSSDSPLSRNIRPLCPTRWLCRHPALAAVFESYGSILDSLQEMSEQPSTQTTLKAKGLYERFSETSTLLGLKIAYSVMGPLEELNTICQTQDFTFSGLQDSVRKVQDRLNALRLERAFDEILADVEALGENFGINPLELPRFRQPPKRFRGLAPSHQPSTYQEYFRRQHNEVFDSALTQLKERFEIQASSGTAAYRGLEKVLLQGKVETENIPLLSRYPEIDAERLAVQLPMFFDSYQPKCLRDAQSTLQSEPSAVRRLFSQVEALVRLLLVCPVSSCEAERSFSCLRRLKTWLRSTMNQSGLNYAAVCNIHKSLLDEIEILELAIEFACKNDLRRSVFGSFQK